MLLGSYSQEHLTEHARSHGLVKIIPIVYDVQLHEANGLM